LTADSNGNFNSPSFTSYRSTVHPIESPVRNWVVGYIFENGDNFAGIYDDNNGNPQIISNFSYSNAFYVTNISNVQ
jgi:hypothetical protein